MRCRRLSSLVKLSEDLTWMCLTRLFEFFYSINVGLRVSSVVRLEAQGAQRTLYG